AHIAANFFEPVIPRLRPLELIFERGELPFSPLPAMPEISVDEDNRFMRRQNDVGFAGQLRGVRPVAQPLGPERLAELFLRSRAGGANLPHDRGDISSA